MVLRLRVVVLPALFFGSLFAFSVPKPACAGPDSKENPLSESKVTAAADSTVLPSSDSKETDLPPAIETIDVLEGLNTGQLAVSAEGTGAGRMTLNLTNRSPRKLRVVLPPGLIAAGATGQFGGGMMGGMGGGMGGMGGGMGGMGMGGGMGGMGGGMGGMGGGMGGMSGGMGGSRGGMGGGTMPASMGMMMLGRLIMTLVGDRDSWDQMSLMSGMMGGMGGMGMGGMGGGMGMGGMGGGMGGGFRSVPPTSLPQTTLDPKQTRHLPTALVRLDQPTDSSNAFPAKGERLRIGDVTQTKLNPRCQSALTRLAEEKAPQTLCQLVMWHVSAGMDWATIEERSRPWANENELALARQFVERLDDRASTAKASDSGVICWEIRSEGSATDAMTTRIRTLLEKSKMLGLRTSSGIPATPRGPALAFRAKVEATQVEVQAATTDSHGTHWVSLGSFVIKVEKDSSSPETTKLAEQAAQVVDATAVGILNRLVHCKLSHGDRVKGKPTYKIRIDNGSPLILNGLALEGSNDSHEAMPSTLAGFCLPPRKSLTVPIASETVQRLGLSHGIRTFAADLSGL